MTRAATSHNIFAAARSEGGLLPPDLLARVAASDPGLGGFAPEEYGLERTQRLNEAIARAWANVRTYWAAFRAMGATLGPGETGVSETRDLWLLPLFRELGYGRLTFRTTEEVGGKRYNISHRAGEGRGAPPVHTVSFKQQIDRAAADAAAGGLRVSPHGLVQEYLNRSDDQLWGVVTNGLRLRLLRDNASLSRAAFVEFDLEAMLDGGAYADFVLLYLLLHRSRLPRTDEAPASCWLERWRLAADEAGTRALDALRVGVEAAITSLGRGLLEHPENGELRTRLSEGKLSVGEYYRQLLRLVYRLLFLLAAEERDLLFDAGADPRLREVYRRHYGVGRLRALAEKRRSAGPYDDLWRSLAVTFGALRDPEAGAALGLRPLSGGLFGPKSCPDIDGALVGNARLLEAIAGLSLVREARTGLVRRVNYRDMDVEELGSVYEGLLELQPVLRVAGERPEFALGASGERKSTGSYYTNDGLVRELIASALDPVIADALARGKTREGKRTQLLDLTVCDPACGSGHFLLAAARRIGREIARLDTGETEPDPAVTREGVREAIRHCIYGVDKNALAVDLCKLALWLEGHMSGRPLGFLDHHIKKGNSLVGATRTLMDGGIPGDAFEPVTGDEKAFARAVKKRNRQEHLNVPLPLVTVFESVDDVHRYFEALGAEDDTLEAVVAKEDTYNKRRNSTDFRRKRLMADLWTAAFFWPLRSGEPEAPTQGYWRQLADDPFLHEYVLKAKQASHLHKPACKTARHARMLSNANSFFHPELEFEEVFEREDPGFDCILGNPPWERVKLQEQEFFAALDPNVATAPNAAERGRRIAALLQTNPTLHARFELAKRSAEGESSFLRKSGRFPLTGRGDVNTYSVFAEAMARGASERGRAGVIVPTGIATDDTNKHFFGWLVDSGRLAGLLDFENRRKLFPEVDSRMKFSLLTVVGTDRPVAPFDVAFFLLDPAELRDPERRFTLSTADIARFNPNTLTAPIFRSRRDAEITRKLYAAAPVLIREGDPEVNPWGVRFSTMFHMSNDSGLFRTRRELEAAGYELGGDGRFRGQGETYLPLYEAKMIHQFDHRFATYESATGQERTRDLTPAEHADTTRLPLPRYWVAQDEVERAVGMGADEHPGWFVTYRDIARSNDERTLISTIFPYAGAGNHIMTSQTQPAKRIACLVGSLNSFAIDFAVRQKVGGIHINFFVVKQFPVLVPSTYTPDLLDLIVPKVLELVYTAHDLAPFARDCGYDGPPFVWEEERRAHLRAELDGIYAHLYGLSREDFDYILDTFNGVRKNDKDRWGEYRTKRLVLAAYDRRALVLRASARPPDLVSAT